MSFSDVQSSDACDVDLQCVQKKSSVTYTSLNSGLNIAHLKNYLYANNESASSRCEDISQTLTSLRHTATHKKHKLGRTDCIHHVCSLTNDITTCAADKLKSAR